MAAVAVVALVALVAAACSSGTKQASPTTSTSPGRVGGGPVVAFGDSVAAGEGNGVGPGLSASTGKCVAAMATAYCGYQDRRWTDSPDAYPAVLARRLGLAVDDFAQSSACAKGGLPNCDGATPTVAGQLSQAEGMGLHPSLVTLTVGADDINFKGCFQQLVGVAPTPPCADSPADLATIRTNVASDLAAMAAAYPGVPIYLTGYYDPLPASLTASFGPDSLCSDGPVLYALHLIQTEGLGGGVGALTALLQGSSSGASSRYLDGVRSEATVVENDLDATLKGAVADARARSVPVHMIDLDFSGHDFCQGYPGGTGSWVLAPSVRVVSPLAAVVSSVSYQPTIGCAVVDAGCRVQVDVSGRWQHSVYSFVVDANDFPHPDPGGQTAIASALRRAMGQP